MWFANASNAMTEPFAQAPLRRNIGVAMLTLIASSGTLVCCVLPATMVALGAGAALAGLVTALPQLIWLSEHKAGVFGLALVMLALSGALLWKARTLPCPADPDAARSCVRLRRVSVTLWWAALLCTLLGGAFAFVLPALR
jgi:uncharacterized iron-regulated membrane protein